MESEFERQLRIVSIERRPEACLGCGFEHGCSVHGCAVIRAAYAKLAAYEATGLEQEDFKKAFNEDAILKLAGQLLGVTPAHLRELAQAEKARRILVLPCSEDELQEMLENLLSVGAVDEIENYTSGYRNGYRNGRIELLKYLLQIREFAEAAPEERKGAK